MFNFFGDCFKEKEVEEEKCVNNKIIISDELAIAEYNITSGGVVVGRIKYHNNEWGFVTNTIIVKDDPEQKVYVFDEDKLRSILDRIEELNENN